MLSTGYTIITITILDIIHRLFFYLKHNFSGTVLYSAQYMEIFSVCGSVPENLCFKQKDWTMDIVQNCDIYIYTILSLEFQKLWRYVSVCVAHNAIRK
jgi:hypothetical protein